MTMKQTERVFNYMINHGSVSALEAFRELGVMRLASRICELRRQGVDIQKRSESVLNRFGERCNITRFFLEYPLPKAENNRK